MPPTLRILRLAGGIVNFTLRNTSLTWSTGGAFTLVSIEQAELSGGAGNNTISAQAFAGEVKRDGCGGNDTLTSGASNDTLRALSGSAVLIGGARLDRLTGGTNDDLLISGQTAHDANALALALLLSEWASTATYADRVAHLTGAPGGLNGCVRLDGANDLHDTAVDIAGDPTINELVRERALQFARDWKP